MFVIITFILLWITVYGEVGDFISIIYFLVLGHIDTESIPASVVTDSVIVTILTSSAVM